MPTYHTLTTQHASLIYDRILHYSAAKPCESIPASYITRQIQADTKQLLNFKPYRRYDVIWYMREVAVLLDIINGLQHDLKWTYESESAYQSQKQDLAKARGRLNRYKRRVKALSS